MPAIQYLLDFGRKDPGFARVLVMTPTRELAYQVYDEFKHFTQFTELNVGVFTGVIIFVSHIVTLEKIIDIGHSRYPVYENEKELFGNGSSLQGNEAYPALSFILEQFVKRGEDIFVLIETVSVEQLQQESSIKIGPDPRTNEALLWFFYNH